MPRQPADLGTKPIVALDIDGTLGDYHTHFRRFLTEWNGKDNWRGWDNAHGSFSAALGVSKRVYREAKMAYRQGGLKRSMPVFPGAQELTASLRKTGAEIWICTTRPYMRLDNIDPDTRHWARRNHISYDYMIYGEKKYQELAGLVRNDRVVAVMDDLPEQVVAAQKVNLPVIWRLGPHTQWYTPEPGTQMTPNLYQAMTTMQDLIKEWKVKNRVR